MGEARRRGSFHDRVSESVEKSRKLKELEERKEMEREILIAHEEAIHINSLSTEAREKYFKWLEKLEEQAKARAARAREILRVASCIASTTRYR